MQILGQIVIFALTLMMTISLTCSNMCGYEISGNYTSRTSGDISTTSTIDHRYGIDNTTTYKSPDSTQVTMGGYDQNTNSYDIRRVYHNGVYQYTT